MIGSFERMGPQEHEGFTREPFDSYNPDKRIDTMGSESRKAEMYNPDKRLDSLFTNREERVCFAAHTDGVWSGEPGNSLVKPNVDSVSGKAAQDKLRKFGLDGIEYSDGVVDFSDCSLESVEIDDMTSSIVTNRRQAARAVAQKWNAEGSLQDDGKKWTPDAVNAWASKNNLDFHECSDMKTCQYVPREIHSYFKHFGGRAECRVREMQETGDGFDE